jgi:methylamine dehydrogenase accessory protein MauD
VLASDGEPEEHRRYVAAHGLEGLPYVVSASVGIGFEVAKLPYAVLIDADGILRARGLINTREHLESLFEAERLGVASIQEWLANDGGGEREAHHPPKAAAAGGRGEQR